MIHDPATAKTVERTDLQLAHNRFSIYTGNGLLQEIRECFRELKPDKIVIITDDTVHRLHAGGFARALEEEYRISVHSIAPGENSKTFPVLESLLEQVVAAGVTKNTLIVSFGGGVVSNIAGMVAGLIFRGLPLVHIPTTVLAQLDAAISRKQAVNGKYGKNLFGLWLAPRAIFADLDFLATLDRRQMASGFAEAIKLGLIADVAFFELFEQLTLREVMDDPQLTGKIVRRAIHLTCRILSRDPYEGTSGASLEIGHTIGHAIEILEKGALTHGEAISIGMVIEARLSIRKGLLEKSWLERIIRVLQHFELPCRFPSDLDVSSVLHALKFDNKRTKEYPCFIAMQDIGKIEDSARRQEHRLTREDLMAACYPSHGAVDVSR